jgi:hypothetical protein
MGAGGILLRWPMLVFGNVSNGSDSVRSKVSVLFSYAFLFATGFAIL